MGTVKRWSREQATEQKSGEANGRQLRDVEKRKEEKVNMTDVGLGTGTYERWRERRTRQLE
jgi:hypothetical protein